MAVTINVRVGDTVPLGVQLVEDGTGVTGLSPTVELRRLSDEAYFDWTGLSWVTVGGTRETVLVEKTWLPGLYLLPWDQQTYDGGNEERYVAIYRNTVAPYEFNIVEIYHFDYTWAADAELTQKLVGAKKTTLERINANEYEFVTFDDDKTTVIRTERLTNVPPVETREDV
jgi:hypothetical protein